MSAQKKFQVAISFAEADKAFAAALNNALKKNGITCYYYPDHPELTAGQPLREKLRKIYKYDAMYAVVVFSKNYVAAPWAKEEFQAIMERSADIANRILPVKIDNVEDDVVQQLFRTTGFLPWSYNINELAETIANIVGKEPITPEIQPEQKQPAPPTVIIKPDTVNGPVIAGNLETLNYNNQK